MNNSRVSTKVPPSPSNDWISRQTPEQTRMIRDPSKSKTLPVFQTPIKQRRKRAAA